MNSPTPFTALLRWVRLEAAQVHQECLDDDGTDYSMLACAAMIVRELRNAQASQ